MTGVRAVRHRALLAALVVAMLSLSGCSLLDKGFRGTGERTNQVTVGGGDFTEVLVLQALYGKLLTKAGFKVDYRATSGREQYVPLLRTGEIDVVPEYAATMTEYLNHELNGADARTLAGQDVGGTLTALRPLAASRGLSVLQPAAAASQNGFAVTGSFARKEKVRSLSELAARGEPITLAATTECPSRPFCQPGLKRVYGITVGRLLPLGYGSAASKQAVLDGDADVALVGTTDGTVADLGLVLLADDKQLQLADNVVPVVNAFSAGDPRVAQALDPLAELLSTADLAALNEQVQGDRRTPQDVAQDYLEQADLL